MNEIQFPLHFILGRKSAKKQRRKPLTTRVIPYKSATMRFKLSRLFKRNNQASNNQASARAQRNKFSFLRRFSRNTSTTAAADQPYTRPPMVTAALAENAAQDVVNAIATENQTRSKRFSFFRRFSRTTSASNSNSNDEEQYVTPPEVTEMLEAYKAQDMRNKEREAQGLAAETNLDFWHMRCDAARDEMFRAREVWSNNGGRLNNTCPLFRKWMDAQRLHQDILEEGPEPDISGSSMSITP